jgi:hypothetical protein
MNDIVVKGVDIIMQMTYNNENKNIVQENEYAYSLKDQKAYDRKWYLNVPKIMPNIPRGEPKMTPVSIPQGILANDGACKPSISAVKSQQNFLYVPRSENITLDYKGNIKMQGMPAIKKGTQFHVKFTDENILTYLVVDDF